MQLLIHRNLKKSINLTGRNIDSHGAFSSYYKYNDTQGIKVLYSDGHTTIQCLRKSQVWRRATKENKLLRKCKERWYNIPQAFGVFPIKIGRHYYPGIVMQHIYGKTLHDSHHSFEKKIEIINTVNMDLIERGIYHDDLHKGNIIVNNGTYYVIDFTYDLIWLDNGHNERL